MLHAAAKLENPSRRCPIVRRSLADRQTHGGTDSRRCVRTRTRTRTTTLPSAACNHGARRLHSTVAD